MVYKRRKKKVATKPIKKSEPKEKLIFNKGLCYYQDYLFNIYEFINTMIMH